MGTRCVVTFKDQARGNVRFFSVYKHWDGNPENIFHLLDKARAYAWKFPRFEAADFACAFIRVSKEGQGDVYLTTCADDHGDLSYSYYVSAKDGKLFVTCYDCYGKVIHNDYLRLVTA